MFKQDNFKNKFNGSSFHKPISHNSLIACQTFRLSIQLSLVQMISS